MSEVNKDYDLKVLKMIVNKYLDESTSVTEKSIKTLETNRDQVVWDLATKIYSQSGHKVELSTIRDVVDSRIEAIKYQIAVKKKHIAEEARRIAEEKARLAEEARRIAEEKAHHAVKEKARLRDKITSILGEFGGDESKAEVFIRVREVVVCQLDVDESRVTLDSSLPDDLGVDELDLLELVMALEEEFDIEIPDEEAESVLGLCFSWSSHSYSSGSLSVRATENCIVKNFVDFILQKILETSSFAEN